MKNFIILLNVAIILWVTSIFSVDHSSKKAELPNQKSFETKPMLAAGIGIERKETKPSLSNGSTRSSASREALDFIQEATEARVLIIEHGKVAQQRATNRGLKNYATLMISDQSRMLEDLKSIASKKRVEFSNLGRDKSAESKELNARHGKDFDDKFIKMMVIDHKRDIKTFEKALYSSDPDIQVFATKYIHVVKTHLDGIKSIKRK